MASSAPYDPIEKFGSGWKKHSDGTYVRVVVHEGRYCLETDDGRRNPIQNTINPPRESSRAIPRTERRQSEQRPEQPARGQSHGSYNQQTVPTQRQSTPEQTSTQYDRRVQYSYSPQDEHYEIAGTQRPHGASRQYHDGRRRDDRQSSNPSGNQNQSVNARPAITSFQGDQRQQIVRTGTDQPTTGRAAAQPQTVTDRSRNMSYNDSRSTNRTAAQTQSTNARARGDFNVEDLGLDRTVSDFVKISLANFPACHDYIKRNKAVLDTSLKDVLSAAPKAAKIRQIILSKQCIQRYVLLKTCRDLNSAGRAHYFEQLATPGSRDSRAFYGDCDHYEEQMRSQLEKSNPTANAFGNPTGASRDQAIQYSPAHPSTMQPRTEPVGYQGPNEQSQPAVNNIYPTASAPSSGPGMRDSRRPSVPLPTNPRSTAFELPSDPGYGGGGRDPAAAQRRPLYDESQDRDLQPDRVPNERTRDSPYDPAWQKYPTAEHGRKAEFRPENTDHSTELDPRYRKQNANTFFVPGRVFSVVRHDNLGLQQGKSKSNKTKPKDTYKGYKGVEIFGHVRRMIVCRQRQGYSLCVPISSYGNHGVADKKVGEREKQAHAIVYPYGSAVPRPLSGEPRFEKKPIAINMGHDHTLTESSRIHFGKCHTVEHNVKVMDIGEVAKDSMANFELYCREELLR
nr:hypothetical protein LTR18_001276 [Exophiala xenobiotica]